MSDHHRDHGHVSGYGLPGAPCCCHGRDCHDAPPPRPAAEDRPPDAARADAFRIEAMDCPTEEAMIRKALSAMPGVAGLRFDLLARELTVHHDLPDTAPITAAIAGLGMEAVPLAPGTPGTAAPLRPGPLLTPILGACLLLAVVAETAGWLGWGAPWLSPLCAGLAMLGSGLPIYRKGFAALKNRTLNINALMSVAATGAVLLGELPEAAMVVTLFAIAERLEAASLVRARNAVAALLALTPEEATTRRADGAFVRVPAAAVPVGSVVRLAPGERVPLDGVVAEGHSAVDQSPITGESLPADKGPGDALFAGTVNQEGELLYETTALAGDSTLARIIRSVTSSPGKKAKTQRFVDRFAAVYTPAVFACALGVGLVPPLLTGGDFVGWIYKALVLLVIACPCALVISTPVSVVSGLAAAARRGILVKGGLFLEQGHALRVLALDKTGTVTLGRPVQTDFRNLAGDADRNRSVAASLAARSNHPVSRAVAEAAENAGVPLLPVTGFTALPGRGVGGVVAGEAFHLGNRGLVEASGPCPPSVQSLLDAMEAAGKTSVLLAGASGPLALFAVADAPRPHSREAVAALRALGVETLLLSGDNARTAAAIAREAGIGEARGGLLPDDKAAAIDALEARAGKGLVGMVGDGINDAAALARADIGFAMAAAGTDAAIETADVAVMDDDLRKIAAFIRLSRATVAILRQNIALALGLKGLVLALTFLGYGSMLLAVFADMGTSLLVTGNGLRLLRK